jgi:hypothetical protein
MLIQILIPILIPISILILRSLTVPQTHTLLLEAGTSTILYDVFGIPNMHLSYGVVEQTVNGLADTRYILQVP